MRVEFQARFARDLRRIRDRNALSRIRDVIEEVESSERISDIRNLRRLRSEGTYYRIRVGDYRIGFILEQDTIIFARVLHRSEIYRYFP